MNYKIGITGDIASGKSTVSDYLKSKGFKIIDADKIAREVVDIPEIAIKINETFPGVYEYGKLDRKKLGKIVFSDKKKMKKLEDITHPQIRNIILEELYSSDDTVFLDAPLLYEGGYENYLDVVIYILSDEKIRLDRIVKRDNISLEEAKNRIRAFTYNREEKISKSYVIENNSVKGNLIKSVDEFLKKYDLFAT